MMALAMFEEAVANHLSNLRSNPLRQAEVNPFVAHKTELAKAQGMEIQNTRRFGRGFGAIKTYTYGHETLKHAFESPVHFDKEMTARARLYLYRHHQLDNNLIDQVFADDDTFAGYKYEKKRLCRLQTTVQAEALWFAVIVVERSIHRGGGMQRWRESRASQRRRFWKDNYQPIKLFVDLQMFHWLSHGVKFDVIHGIDTAETLKYRKKNEIVVLELLEATWNWIVNLSFRFDYGVRNIWRTLPNHPDIVALDIPEDAMLVPANPGGVEGISRRKEAIRTSDFTKERTRPETFPTFNFMRNQGQR
ncbi:hypothetical protein KC330_g8688 [Hortaea werneckii]|nr:hypothetical protein KC330_g8688 [Hortaea werneckii]